MLYLSSSALLNYCNNDKYEKVVSNRHLLYQQFLDAE